jgi:hypothetical protein
MPRLGIGVMILPNWALFLLLLLSLLIIIGVIIAFAARAGLLPLWLTPSKDSVWVFALIHARAWRDLEPGLFERKGITGNQ